MDFHVENLGPCRKKVQITIPTEQVKEEYDRQFREINDSIVYPGFRKGHTPRNLLEKKFGETLGKEVRDKLVEQALEKLFEEKKVEPLESPNIDLETLEVDPGAEFGFEFEILTRPEFTTPGYEGLEIEVPKAEVKDEDIQEAVDYLRRSEAKLESEDGGKVQDEDILVVDWEAKDGDSVEAHDENAYYPYGRGVLAGFVVEGLDKVLKGKKVGATAEAKVKVAADDPREELREKELDLTVTLKAVKRYVLPEINAAFLERHDYDDEKEMRDELEKQIVRGRTREIERDAETGLVDQLVAGLEISLPDEFVQRDLENWARRQRMQLEMEKKAEDEITKQIDAERADAKQAVETDMRRFFVLDRIASVENVNATETDLLQAIQEIARAYNRPETEVLASYRDGGRLSELATQIQHRKVRELIRRKAKLVETAEPKSDK